MGNSLKAETIPASVLIVHNHVAITYGLGLWGATHLKSAKVPPLEGLLKTGKGWGAWLS